MEREIDIKLNKEEILLLEQSLFYYKKLAYKHDIDLKQVERLQRKLKAAVNDEVAKLIKKGKGN